MCIRDRYYSTPTEVFREAGISTVIWANHLVRGSASAMQSVAKEIHDSETLVNVEDRVASVDEIFRLQNADEYTEAERVYLTASQAPRAAVVLAASRGAGLESLTADKPKVMLPIAGKPLLRWMIDGFKKHGVNDITVVGGYRADAIDTAGIKLAINERHGETGELASLACAVDKLRDDTVISYGDLLFRSYIVRDLLDSEADFCVVVDSSATPAVGEDGAAAATPRDLAFCSSPDTRELFGQRAVLQRVAPSVNPIEPERVDGQWVGLLSVRGKGRERLQQMVAQLRLRKDFDKLDMPALLNALVAAGEQIEVLYVHGHWRNVNDLEDFRRAGDFAHAQTSFSSSGTGQGND